MFKLMFKSKNVKWQPHLENEECSHVCPCRIGWLVVERNGVPPSHQACNHEIPSTHHHWAHPAPFCHPPWGLPSFLPELKHVGCGFWNNLSFLAVKAARKSEQVFIYLYIYKEKKYIYIQIYIYITYMFRLHIFWGYWNYTLFWNC